MSVNGDYSPLRLAAAAFERWKRAYKDRFDGLNQGEVVNQFKHAQRSALAADENSPVAGVSWSQSTLSLMLKNTNTGFWKALHDFSVRLHLIDLDVVHILLGDRGERAEFNQFLDQLPPGGDAAARRLLKAILNEEPSDDPPDEEILEALAILRGLAHARRVDLEVQESLQHGFKPHEVIGVLRDMRKKEGS